MARRLWPLRQGRPLVEVVLPSFATGPLTRDLLADTGAGNLAAGFDLLLDDKDCLQCGGIPSHPVVLGGAFKGTHPVYLVRIQVTGLQFDRFLRVIGISTLPTNFQGIAAFCFLNRFTYGNFGSPTQFGLEV